MTAAASHLRGEDPAAATAGAIGLRAGAAEAGGVAAGGRPGERDLRVARRGRGSLLFLAAGAGESRREEIGWRGGVAVRSREHEAAASGGRGVRVAARRGVTAPVVMLGRGWCARGVGAGAWLRATLRAVALREQGPRVSGSDFHTPAHGLLSSCTRSLNLIGSGFRIRHVTRTDHL